MNEGNPTFQFAWSDEKYDQLPESWQCWKIEDRLGRGSYGSVYRVSMSSQPGTQKRYAAVKVITVHKKQANLQDILNEIKTTDVLKGHPNIVEYMDYRVEKDPDTGVIRIYILMPLLTSLKKFRENRHLDERQIAGIGIDICNALIICRKYHILHRDIKPDNILVSDTGCFMLGDFGISREILPTESERTIEGTPAFMAPEVYLNRPYDFRLDQYSLGMTLYRMLNRDRDPFLSLTNPYVLKEDKQEAFAKRMHGMKLPLPADASERLGRIICKACEFNPSDRYSDISQMRADLISFLRGNSQEQSTEVKNNEDTPKSYKVLIEILFVLLVFLVAFAIRKFLMM